MTYLLKKIGSALVTLFLITTLIFILTHIVPGSPFDTGKRLPEAIANNLNYKYDLDAPLAKKYAAYLQGLAAGNLGGSIKNENKTVNMIIREAFPISALLGAASMGAAVFLGVLLGCVAAGSPSSLVRSFVSVFITLGTSVPSFIFGGVLLYFFVYRWQLLPVAYWAGPAALILPVVALAFWPAAVVTRLVRTSMEETLAQDHILTARGMGLPRNKVIYQYALKNSLFPALSFLGPAFAAIITGSFIIESIFALPGLGKWFVMSVLNRDYTLIVGLSIFYSALLISVNMFIDVLYALLDPRVQFLRRGGDYHG